MTIPQWRAVYVAAFQIGLAVASSQALSAEFGACVHVGQNRNPLEATESSLARAGLSFRDDVMWGRFEKTKGDLVYPESLRDLDTLVTQTVARGGRPLLILDFGNSLYDNGELPRGTEAVQAYARYVRFVVQHFLGRVDRFEVWNEWNIGMGSPQRPRPKGDAADYVALLRAAYAAIKAENPKAMVVGGSVSGRDNQWIDEFGKAGGFQYLDVFSVHPYVYWSVRSRPDVPPSIRVSQELRRLWSHISLIASSYASGIPLAAPVPGTPEHAIAWLDTLKATVDRFAPGANVPIYVTEMGWPTNTGAFGVSENLAAAYLQRFVLLAQSRPWIAGVWWYDLFDDGGNPADREQRFGLLRQDGTTKPAFDSLVAIRDLMNESPVSAVTEMQGPILVSGLLDSKRRYRVAWIPTDRLSDNWPWPDGNLLLNSGFHMRGGQSGTSAVSISPVPTIFDED